MANSASKLTVDVNVADLPEVKEMLAERDRFKAALDYINARGYPGASFVARKALSGESVFAAEGDEPQRAARLIADVEEAVRRYWSGEE